MSRAVANIANAYSCDASKWAATTVGITVFAADLDSHVAVLFYDSSP